MTSPLSPSIIYVEGESDQKILETWFPNLQFEEVQGKNSVRNKTKEYYQNWGLLDRDFAEDSEVEVSRQHDNRVIILRRYSIENYLLEPAMIAEVARRFAQQYDVLVPWADENFVQSKLFEWAQDLNTYVAANYLISQWKVAVESDFRRYFGPLPPQTPLTYDQVLEILRERLGRLPSSHEIDTVFKQTHEKINHDFSTLDGIHRWINGKVLLERMLYHEVFSQHSFGQDRLVEELIEAGRNHIPDELVQLAQKWES